MLFNGVDGYIHFIGDLFVEQSVYNLFQYYVLFLGKFVELGMPLMTLKMIDDFTGDLGRHGRSSIMQFGNAVEQFIEGVLFKQITAPAGARILSCARTH
jgi:hypothetical protein